MPSEGGRPRRRGVAAPAVAGALLLAACAGAPPPPPPEIETSRVYEGASPGAVFERTLAAVRNLGLRVTEADRGRGVIVATAGGSEPRGWAACEVRRVTSRGDDTRRSRRASPVGQALTLTASVGDAPGGAVLTLDAEVVEELRDSFTNLTFTQTCRSTGALEARVLQAVSDRGGAA